MNNIIDLLNQLIKDTEKGVKGYLKAQLILMFLTFIILGIGLVIIDAPLPILIALIIAILDIVPILGSGIVMIPWSIISFISGNNSMGINLAILYVVATITRQIIEPKITGDQIGIRPIYTFIATLIGSMIFGPIGVIAGPIIVVILKSLYEIKNKTE